MKTAVLLFATLLAADVALAPTKVLAWTEVTTNINGGPCVVAAYEVALTPEGVDLNGGGAPLAAFTVGAAKFTGTGLSSLLTGRPDGRYNLQVRAQGANGLWSAWSAPLTGVVSTVAPAAPGGLKVR